MKSPGLHPEPGTRAPGICLLAPGGLFHATRQPSTLMRINFAATQDAQFWKMFASLRGKM